ncbi:MAG TPA: ribosome biogenesis factor YjgA [Rhodanobacteraceae bacterium]|nr:ribosome biogenesis factor YjgA [Rhodanobacteraceae bacterium]
MARKPRYEEPAEAEGADELEMQEGRGRSARKRASHELTKLGEELLTLRPEQLAALALPERLEDAVAEVRRLTSFGAKRRQIQFIGKLMRQLDEAALSSIRSAVERH